jgi:hypothetical protein
MKLEGGRGREVKGGGRGGKRKIRGDKLSYSKRRVALGEKEREDVNLAT